MCCPEGWSLTWTILSKPGPAFLSSERVRIIRLGHAGWRPAGPLRSRSRARRRGTTASPRIADEPRGSGLLAGDPVAVPVALLVGLVNEGLAGEVGHRRAARVVVGVLEADAV